MGRLTRAEGKCSARSRGNEEKPRFCHGAVPNAVLHTNAQRQNKQKTARRRRVGLGGMARVVETPRLDLGNQR
jgi:hypothetical protein